MGFRGSFECAGRKVEAEIPGPCLITEAADVAGLVLNTSCGGAGVCGGCAVDLLEGTFQQGDQTIRIAPGRKPQRVLGCQVRILAPNWRVGVPRRSLVEAGERVVVDFDLSRRFHLNPAVRKVALKLPPATLEDSVGDFERIVRALRREHGFESLKPTLEVLRALPDVVLQGNFEVTVTLAADSGRWEVVQVEPGDTSGRLWGIAADLGTTTIACSLVDLVEGRIVDTASCYNQQVQRCEDVASRIVYAQQPGGLEELHRLVVDESINRLIRLLCNARGIRPDQIARAVISGNTVMAHLLLRISPKNIGGVPFQPSANFPGTFKAGQVGILINPAGLVDVIPSISGYVGGDIVSGTYVCDAHEARRPTLVIDIGTNGEIALSTGEGMWACATPAGPAYEGGGITCGMRATTGAIETIHIDPDSLDVAYKVIGDVKPVGICGSGLIDFLAEARRSGLIDKAGRMDKARLRDSGRARQIECNGNKISAFVLVPAEQSDEGTGDILITEKDIEALLQAKAVVYAGVVLLAKNAGVRLEQIERIWLAGGFARHIHVANAITIGMLPALPVERYRVVGNASLAGAFLALVDRGAWEEFHRIAARPRVIELNKDPDFEDEYAFAMFLPNMLEERFKAASAMPREPH